MTDLLESTGTLISGLIELTLEGLGAERRSALAALRFHPELPNTFSLSAALSVGSMDFKVLDGFCVAGLLEQPSYGRFGINAAVGQLLESTDEGLNRGLSYYRQYLDTHRYELSVLTPEVRNLTTAAEYALHAGSTAVFAEMARNMEALLIVRGEYAHCENMLRKALEGLSEPDKAGGGVTTDLHAELLLSLAKVKIKQGEAPEAKTSALAGLELTEDETIRSALLGVLGNSQMLLGELENANATLREAVRLAPVDPSYLLAELLQNHGVVATRLGKYFDAERYTSQGLALARQCENHAMETALLCNLGVLRYHRGEFEAALQAYDEGLQMAERTGFIEKQAALLAANGGTLLALKRPVEAEVLIRKALALAKIIQHRWYVALCYKELGLALLEQNRIQDAAAAFHCVLMPSTSSVRDIQAYAHWGLARVCETRGEIAQALVEARNSEAEFRQMNHHMAKHVVDFIDHLE